MNGKIIVIAHQKGGTGKSTIGSNLGVELSKIFPTKIIDLDIQKSLTAFTGYRKQKLAQELELLHTPKDTKGLMDLMNKHTKGILLIDTGGYDADLQRIAIIGADLIITPVSDSPMELHGLTVFMDTLNELKKAKKALVAHVLFNRIHRFANIKIINLKNDISKLDNFKVFDTVIRNLKPFEDAFFEGKSVVEYDPNHQASMEIKLLVEEIKSILK